MSAATSKVYRDGSLVTVKSEDLVPGDVISLEAGDAVPADSRIIECASLKVEEAALTGESVPVNKKVDTLSLGDQKDVPLGDRKNMLYNGTAVVYGRGKAVVVGTGMDTEMGKIATAITEASEGETPLHGTGHLRIYLCFQRMARRRYRHPSGTGILHGCSKPCCCSYS